MTASHSAEPADGDRRDFTFTAVGGGSVTVTASYERDWDDVLVPSIGVPEVCRILEAWWRGDRDHRSTMWPSSEETDDDVFFAFLAADGRVILDRWSVATPDDGFSLDALPELLPADHYTITEAEAQP